MLFQAIQQNKHIIPMVPDEERLNKVLANADTSDSNEPPQLVHSTVGDRNHSDLVRIRAVCLSCTNGKYERLFVLSA